MVCFFFVKIFSSLISDNNHRIVTDTSFDEVSNENILHILNKMFKFKCKKTTSLSSHIFFYEKQKCNYLHLFFCCQSLPSSRRHPGFSFRSTSQIIIISNHYFDLSLRHQMMMININIHFFNLFSSLPSMNEVTTRSHHKQSNS